MSIDIRAIARRAAALAAIGAIVAGCLDAPVASVAPTPTREPEPTPVTTTYQLDATVWYAGLVIHVDRAVAVLDERGGPVTVGLRIENAGLEPSDLNAPIRLVVGDTIVEPTRESTVPSVPATGTVGASITFELQGVASVDDAIVEIGAEPLHVARVPLTAEGGEPVLLEPVTPDLSGTGTAGSLRIRLRAGLIRSDLPDWSQELDASLQALTLTYDVTYLGDFPGGFAFTVENVALRLPTGEIVKPRSDGHSQSVELIGAGKTKTGLFSRFEIPTGLPGLYRLQLLNGTVKSSIPFTIEP
jgi:hypothetical protein